MPTEAELEEFREEMRKMKAERLTEATDIPSLKEELALLQEQKETLESVNIIRGEAHEQLEQQLEIREKHVAKLQAESDLRQHLIDQGKEAEVREAKTLEQLLAVEDSLTRSTLETHRLKEAAKEADSEFADVADKVKKMTDSGKQMSGIVGGWAKKSKLLSFNIGDVATKWGDIFKDPEKMSKMITSIKSWTSLSNLAANAAMAIAKATMEVVGAVDKARAEMAKATGTGYELQGVLIDAGTAGRQFGLEMKDAGAAITALHGGTTNFVNLSKQAQTTLTTNVGLLTKLGVSAEVASDMIQTMNLTMGMTMEQAAEATTAIAMMGTQLGISAKQMTKDFQESMKTLAVYGPQATTVFKNLAANAKAAGVEMGSLLKLAGKFDTFKDAATTVAKMNALLGTQLSTTEMLMMTEDERIESLISNVQAQGVAFKDMDRYQQKAVAAAAGISDLNEANKIFGMNLGQFREYRGEMDANADAQQRFKDSLDAAIPMATKFMLLFQELAVLVEPILDGILWLIDGIRHGLADMPAPLAGLIKGFTVLAGVGATLYSYWGPISAMAGGLSGAFSAIAAALGPVGWAVLTVVAAIAALWAIMSMSDEPVAKFNTNMSAIGPDTAAKTRRAGAGMTQNTVNYARSTNTTVNSGGGAPKTIVAQFGEKEFKGVVEDYSRPVAENVATS